MSPILCFFDENNFTPFLMYHELSGISIEYQRHVTIPTQTWSIFFYFILSQNFGRISKKNCTEIRRQGRKMFIYSFIRKSRCTDMEQTEYKSVKKLKLNKNVPKK